MKVMYAISTLGHGRGGHFYDLKVISDSLQSRSDGFVINIGLNESPIINQCRLPVYNLYFNGFNFITVLIKIFNIVKVEKPNIINSFDESSFLFSRIISYIKKIPLILTKCGGPNPKGYFPISKNIILMSKEDLKFFKNKEGYSNTIYLPNRCAEIKTNYELVNSIKKSFQNKIIFMRISRINEYYKESLLQSVLLIDEISKKVDNVVFLLVGSMESREVIEMIKEKAKNIDFQYFSDDLHTKNAAKLIEASDFLIGTGRSILEGAYFKKNLLTPLSNQKHPVLITPHNFKDLFATNFSPRNKLELFSQTDNLDEIVKLIKSNSLRLKNGTDINSISHSSFQISQIIDKYIQYYQNVDIDKNINLLCLMKNMIKVSKQFLKGVLLK